MKKIIASLFVSVCSLVAFPAYAANYTLFGDASIVSGGNPINAAQLVSDSSLGWGGIDFNIPAGTTLADLTHLQTDYKVTVGDCGGGSPRFQINVDGKNIFVYLGPGPNFTGCPLNTWTMSEEFIGSTDKVFDLSQLGGQFYSTYSDAIKLLGTHSVTGIQLLVDAGWAVSGGAQTILADNVRINSDVYTFDPPTKDQCKKDGWKSFGIFKNQGDCVSFVVTGGKNLPAGK